MTSKSLGERGWQVDRLRAADDVWIIGMDGTGLKQVTTGDNLETRPVFSPEGRFDRVRELRVVRVGGPYSAIAVVVSHPDAPTKLDRTAEGFIVDGNHTDASSQGRISAVQHMAWR